jgi:peptidoglycan/xylan/chitin deacetylase (PgdA/CDA1 family)
MVSSLLYVGLEALGIPRAVRLIRRAGIILCYHNVVSDDEAATSATPSLHTSLARFEFQVRWLARHYEIVSLREFVERVEQGKQVRRLAALTFDDGYAGVFEHAMPLLESLGIPATVFVIAEAPGRSDAFWWDHLDPPRPLAATPQCLRPADWPLIATAARQGVDIGVHSATHRSLPQLTDDELQRELIMSRQVVQRETGVTPDFFAYPYGLWDERVRAAVRAAGYRAAVTLDPGLNRVRADPWALRRINVPAGISNAAFRAWTAGLNPRWALR